MAQSPVSPLTGIFEEDRVILDFGEYEGKSVLEVACCFPDYYELLIERKEDSEFFIRRGKDKDYRLYMNIVH